MDINFKEKCFKCGGEVEKGYIQSSREITWVPKLSKMITDPHFINNSVILSSDLSNFAIWHVDAYLCKKCESVFVDYSHTEK